MKRKEDLLKIRPGDKLREVIEMMKTQGVGLMTLTGTHLSQTVMYEVGKYLQQEGPGGGGIAASRKEVEGEETLGARNKAGVYYIWDPTQRDRARVQALGSRNKLEVYGVYMPVRNNKRERAGAIWEKVTNDITNRGTGNFIINGDFNAETEAWIEKTGRVQMEEDVVYQGILEDLNLIPSVTGDHTFERAHGIHGHRGKGKRPHKMVLARLAWEMKGKRGESRPTRRHTSKFQEEHWHKYERILTESIQEIRASMMHERPSDRLRILQDSLMRATAETVAENMSKDNKTETEEDRNNKSEEKELNKGEQIRQRQRHQLFMWNRHLYHARRYTGGKGKTGGFWRRKEIRRDCILNTIATNNIKARKARVIEICEEQRIRAEECFKGIRREINKSNNTHVLIQSLMSLGTGAGNVVTRIFDIVKKAGGNGARAHRGVAGVYQDDDTRKPIIRGPEIREEIHKIATEINKTDALDIPTVKKVLEWV
eukprot:6206454-Pleurochrysis_carterae.AAC.3